MRRFWRTEAMTASDKPTSELTCESAPLVQERVRPRLDPMRIPVQSDVEPTTRADVLVAGVFSDGTLSPAAKAIDKAGKGKLSALLQRGDLGVRAGASLLLHDAPGTAADRLLLVSLGPRESFSERAFRSAIEGA